MERSIHNMKFRNKIILIFSFIYLLSTGIGSVAYYQFMEKDIMENFRKSSEDVMIQTADTFSARFQAVNMRIHGVLTNNSFFWALSDYLNKSSEVNTVQALGIANEFLRNLRGGDSLVSSTYIYTNIKEFDDFVKIRNWEFDFKDSIFFEPYQNGSTKAIQWFPAMEDQIFLGKEEVIPYVRRFSVQDYMGDLYLVIQYNKKKIESILSGKNQFFDKTVILDAQGNYVAGSKEINSEKLQELAKEENAQEAMTFNKDYEDEDGTFLVAYSIVPENGWQIFGLRSRNSLLENLNSVKDMLLQIACVLMFVSILLIFWFSHELTDALKRLEKRMSYVQNGDLAVRFFHPYHDEIGSLAKSFNYMIGEIQSLVKKQEETIEELKIERDRMTEMQKQKRNAELRALQAQINPHFLYNTLNAITWQADEQGAEEVSILSSSLGKFFRLSLSKGMEIISLKNELEHVSSYLNIQSIRYRSRIQYDITIPTEWMDNRILKLVLQPLAENSIYHGIKEKGSSGTIRIYAEKEEQQENSVMRLIVWDDGVGIPPEKLQSMNQSLERGEINRDEGYGIYNVNERIRLYYGENYGLQYESEYGEWTKAILTIPFGNADNQV